MPSGQVHRKFYKMFGLTDQEAQFLQNHIDGPASFAGPAHRKYNHSWTDVAAFCMANGAKYAPAYASHILLDPIASKDRKLKVMLEMWAMMDELRSKAQALQS